jgi:alpha-mannosidase
MVEHDGNWRSARIPQMAWEYCSEPIVVSGVSPSAGGPFLSTSENVIVECLRREGNHIEIRLAECFGEPGTATLSVRLPHKRAFLTDMLGGNPQLLPGGPRYAFPVRPQQIVTVRLRTGTAVDHSKPLVEWDELVLERKRAALHQYSTTRGHPPRGEEN